MIQTDESFEVMILIMMITIINARMSAGSCKKSTTDYDIAPLFMWIETESTLVEGKTMTTHETPSIV